jgi:hypothetical protein
MWSPLFASIQYAHSVCASPAFISMEIRPTKSTTLLQVTRVEYRISCLKWPIVINRININTMTPLPVDWKP